MGIELRSYQKQAMEKALSVKNALLCMSVGAGKTLTVIFLARYLLNRKEIDKTIIACTLSSIGPFQRELKKLGVETELTEKIEGLVEALNSRNKFILIKHSLIEELGSNKNNVDIVEDLLKKNPKKLMLIIDEAHKFSNHESIGNFAIDITRHLYEKIVLLTGTPYSSKLDQLYGLVKLIYPKKWKNLKAFRDLYVRSEIVKNWKTGKFIRTEDIEYINLPALRLELEAFTFFWFPPKKLNYINYTKSLTPQHYEEYSEICKNVYAELKVRAGAEKKDDI